MVRVEPSDGRALKLFLADAFYEYSDELGEQSVHSLLTIPSAQGLFQKAIIQSGGGRDGVLTGRPIREDGIDTNYPVSAETIGRNFAKRHGIQGTDAAALAKLRALPVVEIVDGGNESDGRGGPPIYSGPILDGKLVVETAESSYKAGHQAKVPLIIGSNSAEVPAGFVNARSKEELLSLFGNFRDEANKAYDSNGTTEFAEMLTMVNTDQVWAEPARFTARAFTAKGAPAYFYLFSYVSPSMRESMRFGAAHASEIPYVFDNLRGRNGAAVVAQDQEVARMMNTYWANFAKTGNPNGKGLPEWPVYNPQKERTPRIPIGWIGSRYSRSKKGKTGCNRAGDRGEETLVQLELHVKAGQKQRVYVSSGILVDIPVICIILG